MPESKARYVLNDGDQKIIDAASKVAFEVVPQFGDFPEHLGPRKPS